MNLIFLTLIDLSNISERGIYQDLLRKFKDEGHHVYVMHPLERRKNLPTVFERKEGIYFIRVRTLNIQKTNFIEKGVGTILLEQQFLKAFNKFVSKVKFDLILYSTPPVTFSKLIKYIKQREKAFSYLLLKDIFPQNAVDLGMIKRNGLLHRFFIKKERELYKNSDFIGCMSPANVNYIRKHNPQLKSKLIEVNPNSIAPIFKDLDSQKKKEIREKNKIPLQAIVFIYGGNLGKPQGIDFLIQILNSNSTNNDIFFIIAGQGTEFKKLNNWLKNNNPSNALLFDALPKNEYDNLLKTADVGLIFLDKRFTIPNFPSRLLSYLENKMPVLAATDKNTDVGRIIEHAKCGFWCESGDIETFGTLLKIFLQNRALIHQMGQCSYNLLVENYNVGLTYKLIMDKIKKTD